MNSPGTEWYWGFHALREFRTPLETYAGFDSNTRLGYMAALSIIWDARAAQHAEAERRRRKTTKH